MSGSDKTEQPTAKRLSDAREQGQVVHSPDFTSALVLGTGSIILASSGGYWGQTFKQQLTSTFALLQQHTPLTEKTFTELIYRFGGSIIPLIMPLGVMLCLLSGVGAVVVSGWRVSSKPLQPDLNKLNIINGVKRLFGPDKIMALIKSLAKFGFISAVIFSLIQGNIALMPTWQFIPLPQLVLEGLWPQISTLIIWISVTMLVIGVVDWRWNAHQYIKKLKMSRQEVLDEHKNQDGDPKMKAKIRRMGRQLLEKRQLQAVPQADVIINNPTHFSVAIQYDPDLCPAPRVIAKGQDFFALKMREVAKANNVPMVENKPLARSLYATVEVDHMIPPELFLAVAEVLAYVYAHNKGRHR
jgi:flagellar biosynthesis protein FlhB